jgi:hypothetical protein
MKTISQRHNGIHYPFVAIVEQQRKINREVAIPFLIPLVPKDQKEKEPIIIRKGIAQ